MGIFAKIEQYGDKTAIIHDNQEISYKELAYDADMLSSKIGDRCFVFLVCSNTYPSLMGYVSFLRAGIVPLMVNAAIDEIMFDKLIAAYHPQYIWQPQGYYNGGVCYQYRGYELIHITDVAYEMHPDLALLLTTSGSTGSPKYVKQSYDNIISNAESIIEYLEISDRDKTITTMPMSYTYGLSIINTHLLKGASIVLTEATIMQKEFWELFRRCEINSFGGVPYTYSMLQKLRFSRMDLSNLRYITQAGGRLGETLHSEFVNICEEKDVKFIVMYGQTEATARMSWLPWAHSKEKVGSIGIAIPNGRFSLKNDAGEIISECNVPGELVYQGKNVTMGYAMSASDLIVGDERQGILETGDIAYRDEDGFYYIVGRKKRFLKVYGNRVNLDDIDSLLREGGYEAVSAGKDDLIKIYAVNCLEKELIDYISKKVGLNRQAFQVVCIEEIPRNESGKILYSELK